MPRAAVPLDVLKPVPVKAGSCHVADVDLLALEAAASVHEPVQTSTPEYDIVKAAFDPLFYFAQNRQVRADRVDPVAHYLRFGAREDRDPTPWFSTAEYRRQYMTGSNAERMSSQNPFYHFLTVGRAKGYAPRAPANFDIFCNHLGMTPMQTCVHVRERVDDVRQRLQFGVLGEMVGKASALDPTIGAAWPAGLRVRVPPASNAIGVRRIGHLIDLQHQAQGRRARCVIALEDANALARNSSLRAIIDAIVTQIGAQEVVVVVMKGVPSALPLDPNIRIVNFAAAMPAAKDYGRARSLIEFIRSLRPEVIVNLEAGTMSSALRTFGKAVCASSIVYQYLESARDDDGTFGTLGQLFYRIHDLGQRAIVETSEVEEYLSQTFMLPKSVRNKIWTLDGQTNEPDFSGDVKTEVLDVAV